MSTVKLVKGSCADQKVDAVVNAANRHLISGSGICGAIYKKAGYNELNYECSKIKTPLNNGDAVITSSCNMDNCKYIIHAVGPNLNKEPLAVRDIEVAYYNSLRCLRFNHLHSIAFPLISSGHFAGNVHNPKLVSLKYFMEAYDAFIKNHPRYDIDVILCDFKEDVASNELFYEFYNHYIKRERVNIISLTDEIVEKMNFDDIIAVAIAESGAQGDAGSNILYDINGNIYYMNYFDNKIDTKKYGKKVTLFDNLGVGLGKASGMPKDWDHIYMGAGNHLFVRYPYFDEINEICKYINPYGIWPNMLNYIIKTK